MKKTQVEQESRVIVGAHGVAAEEDHLALGKVIRVGVISLAIFAVGAVWAWRFQVALEGELQPEGPPSLPAAIGQYEIGIVNQRMFEQDFHAERKLNEQHEALKNGWGDKPGVVAHMPLDKAMDRVIELERSPRAPAPAPDVQPPPTTPVTPPPANPTAPRPNPPPSPNP